MSGFLPHTQHFRRKWQEHSIAADTWESFWWLGRFVYMLRAEKRRCCPLPRKREHYIGIGSPHWGNASFYSTFLLLYFPWLSMRHTSGRKRGCALSCRQLKLGAQNQLRHRQGGEQRGGGRSSSSVTPLFESLVIFSSTKIIKGYSYKTASHAYCCNVTTCQTVSAQK